MRVHVADIDGVQSFVKAHTHGHARPVKAPQRSVVRSVTSAWCAHGARMVRAWSGLSARRAVGSVPVRVWTRPFSLFRSELMKKMKQNLELQERVRSFDLSFYF